MDGLRRMLDEIHADPTLLRLLCQTEENPEGKGV